jgi:tRNA-Thr(GGU) m(6)t(6)A37 methyltransferase TsaA
MIPYETGARIVFIGQIQSKLKDLSDCPKQGREGAPDAWIVIDDIYLEGLHGIRVGEELMVLTWLHRADRDTMKVHPRGNPENPLSGVFITRSPSRPNPIGLHRVTLIGIEDSNKLHVKPLEAIDGTPVVDIKSVPK